MSATTAALAAVYRAMAATRVPIWLGRRRDAALVLSYHNVVPDGSARGERVLHVPLTRFRDQVARIARTFRIVSLAELLRRRRDGLSLRGLAALTFDDGYRGVLRYALPVLAELGVPATIFVIAGALERREPFWWDRLADTTGGTVPDRQRLLTALRGDEARILPEWAGTALSPQPWDDAYVPATAAELAQVDRAGVALGLHTISHPNLTRIAPDQLSREIVGCWGMLRERFEWVLPAVAYPYGAVDAAVAREVAATGLTGFGGTGEGREGVALTQRSEAAHLPRLFVGAGMEPDALEVAAAWR